MNRFVAFATIITIALLVFAGCAKKTINTDPYGSDARGTAAGGQAASDSDIDGSDRGAGFQEESLADADRSQALSADAAAQRKAFENQDILFEFDSAVLSQTAQDVLRAKALWLQANPEVSVIIEGHCDDRGTNEYNLALGEKRARNAQKFLVTLGVESSRLSTVSYGEERPLVAGTSEQARAKNRRAHFVIEL